MIAIDDKEMSQNDITGLSIALVDDQKVIWQTGFGHADLEQGVPAAPETAYRAGSIAKLFTASAIMQLAEQGRIDIDKPLAAGRLRGRVTRELRGYFWGRARLSPGAGCRSKLRLAQGLADV